MTLWLIATSPAAEPLPNTKPLTVDGDLAAKMVDGIHKYLDRELAVSVERRKAAFKPDLSDPIAHAKSVEPYREKLKKMLGVVDTRLPPHLEYVGGPDQPSLVAETDKYKVFAVRWAVLPGIDGEGLLLEPAGKAVGNCVVIPDADQTPEQAIGLAPGITPKAQFARHLAENGVRVVVPVLVNRGDELSGNPKLKRATNQPHREFVHRMAYEMGRTLLGYEIQKVLAAVDWFTRTKPHPAVGVVGYGEGAALALYSAACDPRIGTCTLSGYFGPRENLFDEPIYRNVWGLLNEFSDAELAGVFVAAERRFYPNGKPMLAPAQLVTVNWLPPAVDGPPKPQPGRSGAAPGRITAVEYEAWGAEVKRIPTSGSIKGGNFGNVIVGLSNSKDPLDPGPVVGHTMYYFYNDWGKSTPAIGDVRPKDLRNDFDPAPRHKRQFDQLVAFTQKLWRDSDAVRRDFWKKADYKSVEAYEKSTEWYRDYFHTEVIGKLPEPTMPLNPRTRQVYDEPKFTGYEVMIDVYDDVFAYGILLLPKDLKPGEKRPVVVCQHGLEGRPTDTINVEGKRVVYNHFSRRLVELGYIVYAPQNPYIGQTHFRQIQRKAQPLKASLFSFIVRQHQRTIDWLEALPNVDAKRIAFYGLSYGGKTAMRVPAIEKRYCLSICSADFNEWVGKNVSVDLPMSYMWTVEYDMYEYDLGNTFNYAEMAFLIAPRPFMVERGHDDGVGVDEMVASEYAKIRYLYANRLKIPDRTAIEFFAGVHEIRAKGTFEFLKNHLAFPK